MTTFEAEVFVAPAQKTASRMPKPVETAAGEEIDALLYTGPQSCPKGTFDVASLVLTPDAIERLYDTPVVSTT